MVILINYNTDTLALPDMSTLVLGTGYILRHCAYISGNALMSVLQLLNVRVCIALNITLFM